MVRTKTVVSPNSSEVVELTPAENDFVDAEEAAWADGAVARAAEAVQNNRRAAYQSEADHLHLEEERGEVAAGTWVAKVNEIKARFPKA
jgi:hypothetical protein